MPKVIILCGGQGTRMREETEYRPKPLVEIGEKPVVWHIMKNYAHFGFSDYVLCLGYKGNMIKEYFLNYEAMNNDFTISLGNTKKINFHDNHEESDFAVTLAHTGEHAMTGARVKRVERYIDGDDFMVTYGDGLSNVDITKLYEFHKSHNKIATVTTVRPVSRFGVLEIDKQTGKVESFSEKPQHDGWINAGFFVFDRRVFEYLEEDDSCVLEEKPLERLSNDGQLMAYRHDGFFYAMDSYREFLYLNKLWDTGNVPWKRW